MASAQELFAAGVHHYRHRDFKAAIAHFTAAVELDPNPITYWWHLGEAYKYDRNFAAMEYAFSQLLTRAPDDRVRAWAYFGRGWARSSQGQFHLAIEDFEAALLIGGDDFLYGGGSAEEVFLAQAAAHKGLGQYAQAIYAYQQFQFYSGKTAAYQDEIRGLQQCLGRTSQER
jgi:tetratricopeptide (TPR) repeat protein